MPDLTIDLTCPQCGTKTSYKLRDLKPGAKRPCPRCKTVIAFEGDDLSRVQAELDKFDKLFKNFGK